ncbi:hypothetical protein [Nonomuraea sp. NPDC049309]|uniref:hypothetical protein n=1 Tax=Nonomuraea sp. NPDC049309 TaxID=3364350 RepID=UPI003717D403
MTAQGNGPASEGAEAARVNTDPDVYLDVPEVKVDEITLDVQDLRARVSLQAEVLDLLKLNVGADVFLGSVNLTIKGVEAQALLKVRLDNVARIIDRVLQTIDTNPQLLEHLTRGVGRAVEDLGVGAGHAVRDVGAGAGGAVRDVGAGAGGAVRDLGAGAGGAVRDVGAGAGHAVRDVGAGAGGAVREVGTGAGGAVRDVGTGAGGAVRDVGTGAGEAVHDVGTGAGGAVRDVGTGAGGAVREVGASAGDTVRDATGAVREVAPPAIPRDEKERQDAEAGTPDEPRRGDQREGEGEGDAPPPQAHGGGPREDRAGWRVLFG